MFRQIPGKRHITRLQRAMRKKSRHKKIQYCIFIYSAVSTIIAQARNQLYFFYCCISPLSEPLSSAGFIQQGTRKF